MAKKINMNKASIQRWNHKNQSRLTITQPRGKGKSPKTVILDFKTYEQLDIFYDHLRILDSETDRDPI